MSNFDQTDQHSEQNQSKISHFLNFSSLLLDKNLVLICLVLWILKNWNSWLVLNQNFWLLESLELSWQQYGYLEVVLSWVSRFCLCLELSCLEKFLSWPIPESKWVTYDPVFDIVLFFSWKQYKQPLCSKCNNFRIFCHSYFTWN